MAQAHLVVVGVVAGGHFHRAGTKAQLNIFVGHDGQLSANQGQDGVFAHQVLIALVVRVDGHAGVAQHGLGAGGGDDELLIGVLDGIADVPEVAGHILVFHLRVRQGGAAVGAPVDDAASLVDQALVVKVAEGLPHSLGAGVVHGEAAAVPVAGDAHALLLLHDAVAILGLPVPNPLQKFVAAQVVTGLALFLAEDLLHLDLGGDARVVNTGQPQGGIALHTLVAGQDILKRGVKGVAHMELAGDVGRGHHNGEGLFLRVNFPLEVAAFHPHIVNFLFHSLWFIDFRKFFHFSFLLLYFDSFVKQSFQVRSRGHSTKLNNSPCIPQAHPLQ